MPVILRNARRPLSVCAAVAFLVLAGLGAWRSFDGTWTPIGQERLAYRNLTPLDRDHDSLGGLADPRVLDFWRARLHASDRYYLNISPAHGGIANWPGVLELLTSYYLVPSVRVLEPGRATVVLSWDRPPSAAGLRLSSNAKIADADASFSRVAS